MKNRPGDGFAADICFCILHSFFILQNRLFATMPSTLNGP
jgi:hypothetical protein